MFRTTITYTHKVVWNNPPGGLLLFRTTATHPSPGCLTIRIVAEKIRIRAEKKYNRGRNKLGSRHKIVRIGQETHFLA